MVSKEQILQHLPSALTEHLHKTCCSFPLSCAWSFHITDRLEWTLISHVQQQKPATLQAYDDSCWAHIQCEMTTCVELPEGCFWHSMQLIAKTNYWKTWREKIKCLPVSEFKPLSLSVSSLPMKAMRAWEKKKERMRERMREREREREREKEREWGTKERDRVFQLVWFSLSLSVTPSSWRRSSNPVSLCMTACQSQFYSETQCCPLLSSLPVPSLKKGRDANDKPQPTLWQWAMFLLAAQSATPSDRLPNWRTCRNRC